MSDELVEKKAPKAPKQEMHKMLSTRKGDVILREGVLKHLEVLEVSKETSEHLLASFPKEMKLV
jgi:hypothetical protein